MKMMQMQQQVKANVVVVFEMEKYYCITVMNSCHLFEPYLGLLPHSFPHPLLFLLIPSFSGWGKSCLLWAQMHWRNLGRRMRNPSAPRKRYEAWLSDLFTQLFSAFYTLHSCVTLLRLMTFPLSLFQCQQTWYHEGPSTLKEARLWLARYSLPRYSLIWEPYYSHSDNN